MKNALLFSFLIHALDVLISYSAVAFFIFVIVGEKIQLKKWGKFLLFAGLPSGCPGFALMYMINIDSRLAYVLTSAITLVFITAVMPYIWEYRSWSAFSITCIAAILQVSCGAVVSSVTQHLVLRNWLHPALFYVWFFASYFLTALGVSVLLGKIHFSRLIRYLLEDERQVRLKAIGIFVLELMVEAFFAMGKELRKETVITYNAGMIILTVLLVGILLHISGREESERKIQYQESLLLQQQMYVEHLEQMQKEMRIFRHDYKNMLSGMYLYAKEGEAEKIQEVLEKLEIDFDQKIGEKIHATVQIGNIRMPEMKSLVLSKLTKMNKRGIACRLEVLYPVDRIHMDIWEFNRCLGILLDNAIEAAGVQPKPYVELQLMCHGGFLAVRVANPCKEKVDLSNMWKEGYSTKGENRGLGLSNYRRILERYPEAVAVTSWEDQVFVQELTVPV